MIDDARIPRPALLLGLAGLVPFLWSAATHLSPVLATWAGQWFKPMFLGAYVGLTWGTVVLAFLSGVLWGFAGRLADVGLLQPRCRPPRDPLGEAW